ncbi:MAG: saccharopine dehydrogenase [Bdellovibrionales bacterium RBG_16_40_8]|nr:MAG: saccharopine dehydrogenase [Bdellovibrionales bacterium RBG_16_40_8]
MSKVLIIGAGGVGNVVVKKCATRPEIFSEIVLASRTLSKCEAIKNSVKSTLNKNIEIAKVDADNTSEVVALIKKHKPKLLINVALPYQDLTLMDACLETGIDYLDTANYEPPNEAKFSYSWQWAYQDRFKEKGLMALLGSGFDPGVTNVFTAYAAKNYFDEIHTLDILDCNGGDHGKAFATNFNPEINIREIMQRGRFYKDGDWCETDPLSIHQTFDFAEVGKKEMYLLFHEELESLVKNFPTLKKARFWMTFGQEYLTHLRVMKNIGMTRIDEVEYKGQKIIPLQFLKAVLPDPGSLAENYTGKTNIGTIIEGVKSGKKKKVYIYNICDHAKCYKEVQSQAISYTTGVPAMIGAAMVLTKKWQGAGVYNMEQLNPEPFMAELNQYGLPWKVIDNYNGVSLDT